MINNTEIVKRLKLSATKVIGEENISSNTRSMGSEDFAYFAIEKPAAMFRLDIGVNIFKQFVFDNMEQRI